MNYNHAIKLALKKKKWGQTIDLEWRIAEVEDAFLLGKEETTWSSQTKIRVLNIPGQLLDTKIIWSVYCLLKCAALQITLGSARTLQGLSYIEIPLYPIFNDRMWKTIKPGWHRKRFAGRAMQATPSYCRTQLTP